MASRKTTPYNNNFTAGLLILIVGSILLLQKLGIFFPSWLFSWPVLLIVVGLVILAKRQFNSGVGFIMLLFGIFFLLKREFYLPMDIGPYLIPVGLIVLGLYFMIFKKENKYDQWKGWKNVPTPNPQEQNIAFKDGPQTKETKETGSGPLPGDGGDVVNSQAIFCGVQKRVLSKNFYGGKISVFFGSTKIDLSQADMTESAFLMTDVVFGSVQLIVPPHWELKIEITNVFASIEDKRQYSPTPADPSKVMVIKGNVIFGELEIKSF